MTMLHGAQAQTPKDYPSAWELDGLLTSGAPIGVRPVRPGDAAAFSAFHAALSTASIHYRYFSLRRALSEEEVAHAVTVDYRDRMGFVALMSDRLVGFATYERLAPDGPVAEPAFVVADEVQHHGIASLLFETLAAYARTVGITTFAAEVLADNVEMLDVFHSTGLSWTQRRDGETLFVDIDLAPSAEYVRRCDDREATAEAASIAAVLRPASVAVVGASRRPGSPGHEIVRALLAGDFSGTVYPVNPHASAVCGAPAYPSLGALPVKPDLAIVAVPPAAVPGVIAEAASSGVRAAVIITAGFGEVGPAGAALEAELLGVARRHGMRIVGPNCLGVVNTDPEVRLDATFAGLDLAPGRLALVSQSGALGIALAREARTTGLGLSSFASIGNKLDVSSNDFLCYFERDPRTAVIALYLESFGNPRKFARIARRVGRSKPIVALKAGRSGSGARGARSHTAAAATSDVVVTALLRDAGVIKVDHLDELLDVSTVLLTGRLPAGTRIALVGNSGGPLILAADACESASLTVLEFDEELQASLRALSGPTAAVSNPVDLTADGTPEDFDRILSKVLASEAVDAAIVVLTELPALGLQAARTVLARLADRCEKPIVACLLGERGAQHQRADQVAEIPTPERAAAALAHVATYAAWRRSPVPADEPAALAPGLDELVDAALATEPEDGWLDLDIGAALLSAAGLPVLETRGASSAEEAASLAEQTGYPVVLKARTGAIVHKTDVGAVAVGLMHPEAVRAAYTEMEDRLGTAMGGAVIQPMAPPGVEAIVGVASDPTFGPVVMVGLGGVATDLLGDRAFAVPPLDRAGAACLVSSLRSAPLLEGYRGHPKADRGALEQILEQVARLADELPELAELDCNPVVVSTSGAAIVDCKVRLVAPPAGPGPLFRALRARR